MNNMSNMPLAPDRPGTGLLIRADWVRDLGAALGGSQRKGEMTYNSVNVAIQAGQPDGTLALNGNISFFPSDYVWDNVTKRIVVVQPIQFSATDGVSGDPVVISFLAMDNTDLNSTWAWIMRADIPGLPLEPPLRKLTVNFAAGADQNLTDLLENSTVVPL